VGGKRRNLWPVLLAAAIAIAAGLLLYGVWRSPQRNDLATFWGFAAGVAALAVPGIAWIWRRGIGRREEAPNDRELDHLADLFAGAVKEQWEQAARERKLLWPEPIPVRWRTPSTAMGGPVAAAVGSVRFRPLPGLQPVDEQLLREGDIRDLHKVYGGLGSGRLVIAGAPGSGKSGAAVLLVVAALQYRQQLPESDRANVPVPVMFTLHGWDPNTQRLKDWLALRLQQTYPQLAAKRGALASELIGSSKLSVILDGLDEIPHELRPVALQALSEQANFRLLLLARSDEMASAVQHQRLEGAAVVELQEVGSAEAAAYLTRIQLDPPPDGWRELVDQISCDPRSALAGALSSPLALTLVRDTYRSEDDVRELLVLANLAAGRISHDESVECILEHLLDRVLPAAYSQRPGDTATRYSLQKAQVALSHIAARMNRDNTSDLQWWRIASWTAVTPRIIATGVIFWAMSTFVVWVAVGTTGGFIITGAVTGAAVLGFPIGLLALCTAMIMTLTKLKDRPPKRLARIRWRRVVGLPPIIGGILVGIWVVSLGGIAQAGGYKNLKGFHHIGSGGIVVAGVMAGVAAGLVFGIMRGISYPGADNVSPLTPLTSWRSDRTFSIVRGLVGGLVVGFALGLGFGLTFGLTTTLVAGPIYGLITGLVGGVVIGPVTSSTWAVSLAFVQLTVRWHTPIRLMYFLEDARERGVLRTVGPVYQFRHARLQDRLAEQPSAPAPAHDPSKSTAV
jgi:hypothetical protein